MILRGNLEAARPMMLLFTSVRIDSWRGGSSWVTAVARSLAGRRFLRVAVLMWVSAVSSQVLADGAIDAAEEAQIAQEMVALIKKISLHRQETASGTAPKDYYYRFNQVESLGCFQAEMTVPADLPGALRQGLFAQPGTYTAELRFANASTFDDSQKDLRGLAIRVVVPLSAGIPRQQTFLMNSHPVLFADSAETFLKFIRATAEQRRWWFFLNPFDSHLKALWILLKAREHHASPFDVRYWTTTPHQFGADGSAAKFSAKPCSRVQSELPETLADGYLEKNMKAHLDQGAVCFELMVQRQTDPRTQPIEDPSVLWDPERAPWASVATIRFGAQDFQSNAARLACEQKVFDPWMSLPEHKPLGRMNRIRKTVYRAAADFRIRSHTMPDEQNEP